MKLLKMRATIKEMFITIVFCAIIGLCLYTTGHGLYSDYIKVGMHGTECYWCNLYRFANMENAAFQTRELRRDGRTSKGK